MCNKNFADTVMMSYNVIYSVQKKKLAVSEGGSLNIYISTYVGTIKPDGSGRQHRLYIVIYSIQ